MKYIPADKLIAEIKQQQRKLTLLSNTEQVDVRRDCALQNGVYEHILATITSLQKEQPGVDLEEYIENEINHYGLSLYKASYGTFSASQIDRIIRNSFELGLKASK